jgi:predicted nucleic acid-binding protein
LQLLSIEPTIFHAAAMMTMDAATGLRAGDALHLACALDAKACGIVTLDNAMANDTSFVFPW